MPRGIFLSLDGMDGAGKSTQCRLLAEWLRARPANSPLAAESVILCRDPGGTPIGQRIREVLLDPASEMTSWCEAFLYMASRAQLVDQIIRPALNCGRIVIADRFLLANVVYQGHAGGLPPQSLWELGNVATGGILPDLMLVLDLPPELAVARRTGPADRMESRGVEFYAKVRAGFLAEAERSPQTIKVIDATQSIEKVHESVRREVSHVLG